MNASMPWRSVIIKVGQVVHRDEIQRRGHEHAQQITQPLEHGVAEFAPRKPHGRQ